jgi:hypothetical protein
MVFPIWHLAYFTYHREKVANDEKFLAKYIALFEEIDTKSLLTIQYHAFFMLRRFFFVLIVVFWGDYFAF